MIEGPDEKGSCWPQCVFFKCGNRHLRIQGDTIWCSWINDNCVGQACAYAFCVRGKMLAGNRCGLTIRRLTVETERPDDFKIDSKLKGRLSKRIKDLDDII